MIFKEAPQVELYRRLTAAPRPSAKQRPLVPTYGCLAAYERAVAEPLPALVEAEKTKQELAAAKATAVTEVAKRDEQIKSLEQAVERGAAEGKTATAALQSEVAKRDERIKSLEQAVERGAAEGKTATAALQSEVVKRDERIQALCLAVEQAHVELRAALEALVKQQKHAEALGRNISAVQHVAFIAAKTRDDKIQFLEKHVEQATIDASRDVEAVRAELADRDGRIGALEKELCDTRERSSVRLAASAEEVRALKRAVDIAVSDGEAAAAALHHEVATRDDRIKAIDRERAAAAADASKQKDRIAAIERDLANAVAATSKQHEHVVSVEKKLQACEAWRITAEKEVRSRGEESISLRSRIRDLEGQLLHAKESLDAREKTMLSLKADRDEVESRVRMREQELAGLARQIAECQDRCGSHVAEVAEVKSALQRAELRMAQQQWSLSLAVREVLALRKTPGVWTLTQLADTTDRFILGLPSRYPLIAAASLVKDSGLFDEEWYCGQHGDVAESGLAPVLHYLCLGAARMSDPGPAFKSVAYLTANPDVAVAGENPLLHYIVNGKAEGRSIG